MAQFRPDITYVLRCVGATSLLFALASPSIAATSSQDPQKPLGVLFLPQVSTGSASLGPNSIPEPTEPPLGILMAPGARPAPTTPSTTVRPNPIPQSDQGNTQLSLPGYSNHIDKPNASATRPLGILMSPDPATISSRAQTQPAASNTPSPPAITLTRPSWKTGGQSANRPLGQLLAPDPVLSINRSDNKPVPTIKRLLSVSPVQSKNWVTPGKTSDQPLGRLFTPGKPLDVSRSRPSSPTLKPSNTKSSSNDKSQQQANFSADEMSFDRESGVVTALGNVAVHHQKRSMRADKVTYNRNSGIIQASGNVVFTESTGEKLFGQFVEISGDLKDGIIKDIGIILADRSRIAGTQARRVNGLVTDLNRAVYSPCALCAKDPTKPPTWQIKAVHVVHDQTEKTVVYEDAWIEFFGFPVFYTPYFRHPDPTVDRQSGFLFPSIGNSSDHGTTIQTPYFWNISPQEDATITPIIMTDANPIMGVEYRKKVINGEIEASGSLTKNDSSSNARDTEKGKFGTRGHINSKGRFDIDGTWRWGFDANRATDDTYMRRFGFASPGSLNSRLFTEAFREKSYFSANTYSFQGLESTDEQKTTPFILPLIDFNHVGERDRFGGTTSLDFNFLALTRDLGTDTRRLSMRSRWQRPVVGSFGDIYTFSLGMNTDLYHSNSLSRGGTKTDFNGFGYRAIPEASLDWRLPFIKREGAVSQTLEPVAAVALSPYGGNSRDIPNEDSNELEFDDTNLFSTNRFSGLDRVEGGPRFAYGMKWGVFGSGGGSTRVFLGQSWRPKTDDTYALGSGLENNFSDVVARINVKPGKHLALTYRTRFAPDNLSPNRNEIKVAAGVPAFKVSADYIFLAQQTGSEFAGREELNYAIGSKINRHWRTDFRGVRDMAASEFLAAGIDLIYEDECVTLKMTASRTFFQDRDIEPTDSISIRLLLKTLGEVHTGVI